MQKLVQRVASNFRILVFLFFLANTFPALATLIDRGLFDDGVGGQVHLFYDDDLNVTWLGDANFLGTWAQSAPGITTLRFSNGDLHGYRLPNGDFFNAQRPNVVTQWESAQRWLAGLTVGGFTDWRLPATASDPITGDRLSSEMEHLFEIENISLTSQNPFVGLEVGSTFFWSDRRPSPNDDSAHIFSFSNGFHAGGGINNNVSQRVWAVRTGDVSIANPPPIDMTEPSTILLFGVGAFGLVCRRCKLSSKKSIS